MAQRPWRASAVKMAPLSVSIEQVARGRRRLVERLDHVGGLGGDKGPGGDQQPGVVVDYVEDLNVTAVGQGPMRGVGLPALVG